MTDVTKKPSCPQCGANIRARAKFCPACGATLGALPVPPQGDIRFQSATQIQGDVISAGAMHKHTSQWVQIGAPIVATLVISIALMALAQISGYNVRLWLQDGQLPRPTPRASAVSITPLPTPTGGPVPSPNATGAVASASGVYQTQVNARETYRLSDICVQPGDGVTIKAAGLIKVGTFAGDGGFVGPEGTERGALGLPIGNNYDLEPALPHSVLMFRIVGETVWRSYAAVPARTFTAPSAGCLEFQINDNDPGNNGNEALEITVSVTTV